MFCATFSLTSLLLLSVQKKSGKERQNGKSHKLLFCSNQPLEEGGGGSNRFIFSSFLSRKFNSSLLSAIKGYL
jgi:hypothetical protein